MSHEQRDWLSEIRSPDAAVQSAALESLRDFLRRTLAKGFGRQLVDADLEELSQESVIRVFEKVGTFKGQSAFTTWAAAVAVNVALGELRRRRYQHVSLDDAVASGQSLVDAAQAPDALQTGQLMRALATAMDESLSERQREALHAKLSGLPMMEIARRLGTTRGALYKLLHDARKRLREHLERVGIDSSDLTSVSTEGVS